MYAFPSHHSLFWIAAANVPARADKAELYRLVRSAEPAVVFTSLAQLCVPAFSAACTVDIVEDGELAYRINRSGIDRFGIERADADCVLDVDRGVRTSFAGPGDGHFYAGYSGIIRHRWVTRRPSAADRARAVVLARHCVAVVAEERASHR